MSRLRAVETGRARAGDCDERHQRGRPAGRVGGPAGPGEASPATLVAEVPLRDRPTLATRLGCWPEWLLAAAGLAAAAVSSVYAARRRRGSRTVTGDVAAEGLPDDVVRGEGVLVIVPTYQERLNVESIVARLRASVPLAHVLVVDDAQPGRDRRPGRRARGDRRHRCTCCTGPPRRDSGVAYLAGFGWGLERGYDVLVEMDADGSHQPEQLPGLLAALPDADLVLGSRWVPGGRWSTGRPGARALSPRRQHLRAHGPGARRPRRHRRVPRVPARARWRSSTWRAVASHGYCFQVDLVWRAVQQGLRVAEVPIEFVERVRGDSKMSGAIVREALWRVTVWAARGSGRPGCGPGRRPGED